jgi:heme exporter protein D
MPESMSDEALHARLAEITERSLSRTSRYGHVAMTTVAALMAAMFAYMLYGLPFEAPWMRLRAIVFLWSTFGITCAWLAFGVVVLSRRRPLLGYGEVVAACTALVFSIVFTGCVTGIYLAASDHPRHAIPLPPLAWLGIATTLIAFVVCVHALLRYSRLQALRERLEKELAGG